MRKKKIVPNKQTDMNSIADSAVTLQTSSQSVPSTPPWLGEVALLVHHLRKQGVLDAISERVRFARRRFGRYEVIDFVAVLFGYAISGERTLETFYECLRPFSAAFMARIARERLPARATLSRFLAALTPQPVEALRTLFLADLLARPLGKEQEGQPVGLWDRQGTRLPRLRHRWHEAQAARGRALPRSPDHPVPQRRLRPLCAAFLHGTQARRSRAHSHPCAASPYASKARHGSRNSGNGQYRENCVG
jgi:hypothetical protein